jgi:hypothetical protein
MAKTNSSDSREDEEVLSSHAQGGALRALAQLLGRLAALRDQPHSAVKGDRDGGAS